MARSSRGYTVVGLVVVLLVVVAASLIFFGKKAIVSGFADLIACDQGLVPCPEGYFCQEKKCVAIYPAVDIDNINAY